MFPVAPGFKDGAAAGLFCIGPRLASGGGFTDGSGTRAGGICGVVRNQWDPSSPPSRSAAGYRGLRSWTRCRTTTSRMKHKMKRKSSSENVNCSTLGTNGGFTVVAEACASGKKPRCTVGQAECVCTTWTTCERILRSGYRRAALDKANRLVMG